MRLLLLSCGVLFALCAVWVTFQLKTNETCVEVVVEVSWKILKDFRQQRLLADLDILWADLMTTYDQSVGFVALSLDWNLESTYMFIKLAEVVLLSSEFMHLECCDDNYSV